ncbi:DUF6009 family protein [Streptomyces mirabilis]|uniref:DUF6009 family protein n=1 Tax=Streptomyces mirabilis TaxID=68239 RepID=UPI003685ABB1
MLEDPKALEYEENIVWTEDVEGFDYVRQSVAQSAPSEAVDPRTVAPRVWGEITERAWGAPLDEV